VGAALSKSDDSKRFTYTLRIRCPASLPAAIDRAAAQSLMTASEYVRRSVIDRLKADRVDPAQVEEFHKTRKGAGGDRGMNTPLWPVVEADGFLYGVVCLFAERPDLPQKIIGALACDKAAGKRSALFDYLFVAAPGEAFGAEHYFAGYRVLHPEEVDVAIRASDSGQVVKGAHDTPG
jgi:hypothetical protein